MGCYDTVNFSCPGCGERIAEQTKAGPCNLIEYGAARVPLSVAGGLTGDHLTCPSCSKEWRVRIAGPEWVPLELVDY